MYLEHILFFQVNKNRKTSFLQLSVSLYKYDMTQFPILFSEVVLLPIRQTAETLTCQIVL